MIVVDANHLAYRILFANTRGLVDGGWRYFRHLYLNSILSTARKFNDGKIVIAFDNKSWRKMIYSEYKAGRKEARDANTSFDFAEFFQFFDEFKKELSQCLPLVTISFKLAEADDIVAALARNWKDDKFKYPGEEMIVMSSDKDLQQVKRFDPSIRVWDPIKKSFMREGISLAEAENDFHMKVMLGDKSDNIPGIEFGVGPARATKILQLPKEERKAWFTDDPARLERWSLNVRLMSFKKIPESVMTLAIEKYNKEFETQLSNHIKDGKVDVMQLTMDAEKYCNQQGLPNLEKRIAELVDAYSTSMRRTYLHTQENRISDGT